MASERTHHRTDPVENGLKTEPNAKIGRLLRKSHQFHNPRPLRRANTKTGVPRMPEWTVEEIKLLGTKPDEEVAREIGRTLAAVGYRRSMLRIPRMNRDRTPWRPEEVQLLDTATDAEVAKRLRRREAAVRQKRRKLHIPTYGSTFHRWTRAEDGLLGTMRDEEVARITKHTVVAVKQRRLARGLPLPRTGHRPWTAADEALLGKARDREVARQLGRPRDKVAHRRKQLAIPPFHPLCFSAPYGAATRARPSCATRLATRGR